MPRKRVFDKKTAQTFSLVYRSQDDPRIHDAEASDMVFAEKADLNRQNKVKQRGELENEFGTAVRANEGEAASYGIYYDDSEYDYMQHLRDLGENSEARFIDAPAALAGNKGKEKMRLEDALADLDLHSEAPSNASFSSNAQSLFSEDMLPSDFVKPRNYQDQQDVPDAIRGFQPDMDPRLREVLEALDDEAYVDDDEDIFGQLSKNAEEVDQYEWEQDFWEGRDDDGDEGWESDRTIKAEEHTGPIEGAEVAGGVSLTGVNGDDLTNSEMPPPQAEPPDAVRADGDWMTEYSKFKKDAKSIPAQKRLDLQSSVLSGASALTSGRRKKRKGALTSTSGYSMSSSVLSRTEGQSILDARFDKIEEEYANDGDVDDATSLLSGMTGMSGMSKASAQSEVPQLLRSDFNSVMGEFLSNHATVGNRNRVRVGREKTGLEQLEEIRKGLGPARLKTSSKG